MAHPCIGQDGRLVGLCYNLKGQSDHSPCPDSEYLGAPIGETNLRKLGSASYVWATIFISGISQSG